MRPRKIILLLVLLLVLGGIGTAVYIHVQNANRPLNQLRAYGNVDIRQVQLAFQASGRIQEIRAQEGDWVQPGQRLAQIDPMRYEAAVAAAEAELAREKQVLARLTAGSRPEEIAAARARVTAAEATLRDARLVYERTRALARGEYTSQQNLDNAETAFKRAEAELDAARQALTLAQKGPREEDIAAARAQVDAGTAALRLVQQELADTTLYAPAGGVIQDRILEAGDMAFPQTPVLTLALTDPVWVRAYVSEPDLGRIVPGMSAQVTTDSFPDKRYEGWVGFISPTAEFTPKQVQTTDLRTKLVYRMRVYVCNPQNELRLGMPVTVTVPLDQKPRAVARDQDPCPGS